MNCKEEKMFSRVFNAATIQGLLSSPEPESAEVAEILKKDTVSLLDASRLLLARLGDREAVVAEAADRREKRWNRLQIVMPPLYISDGDVRAGRCIGGCIYCPFDSRDRRVARMTPAEVDEEVKILLDMGHHDIELVAAVDSDLLRAEICAEFISASKHAGATHVGINFFPLRAREDYEIMVSAGLDFTVVWQETYDRKVYALVHPRGLKADMSYRLDAHDRAIAGGLQTVGVGFLGGINADWRFDALAAIWHAKHLSAKGARIIFGTARIKSVEDMEFVPAPFSDEEFILLGAVYSLAVPESLIWWATRESRELNAQAARGGGGLFTIVSETKVAGYSGGRGRSQFPVHRYTFEEGVKWLRNRGFKPETRLPW